jgi:hypothetical protein
VLVTLRPRKRDGHCQVVGDLHIINLEDGKMIDILDSSKIWSIFYSRDPVLAYLEQSTNSKGPYGQPMNKHANLHLTS